MENVLMLGGFGYEVTFELFRLSDTRKHDRQIEESIFLLLAFLVQVLDKLSGGG